MTIDNSDKRDMISHAGQPRPIDEVVPGHDDPGTAWVRDERRRYGDYVRKGVRELDSGRREIQAVIRHANLNGD